jgi:hypothetical protein
MPSELAQPGAGLRPLLRRKEGSGQREGSYWGKPKKMKGADLGIGMSVHLSDLIDEASVMYSEPSFPLPTPPFPSRDTLSPRGAGSSPVIVHDVPDDSDSAKSGHEILSEMMSRPSLPWR